MPTDKFIKIPEKEYWRLISKAVGRALYDAIEAHEKQHLTHIEIDWLRDYADDCVISYEQVAETGIEKDNKQ